MTATVDQIAEVLRPYLRLPESRALWSEDAYAAYDEAAVRSFTEAREASLDVHARQVAEQVTAWVEVTDEGGEGA